jgi:two-component system sensor kinase FixL
MHHPLQSFIIPVQYRDAHQRGMQRYLATGEGPVLNKTIEITALKKTGEEFYISLTISPTSQNGERAFIAFIRDITEQKQNQLELEKKTT